ncbi:MAG: helix-turn-helix transcriptional regulator [Clostridiales bacterium]|nr:helix-turn-helix transcriptional regulator [Clostridiales bacterium]
MDIAEKIRILAVKSKISVQQIAEKSGQSSANLYNKLGRNDFKLSELERIAHAVGATLEVNFILPNGEKL